ncbi:B9 domain protein [Ichthyophthirius multifiliis]|uniref:B9 domain-containing protein 1 n=1 Tax=Ichthyophthirius multifiliis TaxID=5932 RepID=G0R1W6_ICHMU|nr:B9 domain protein [Ichthyophthirius multifiliis]EGR28539.1 B9 domain protein [Ichthyophthirius multifiliis]|eukprot:XP_004029775.1 B9 domain protein [Ichthyophthirius multifiliis]
MRLIESGEFDGENTLMCQYEISYGSNFKPIGNLHILEGKSQFSQSFGSYNKEIIFNLPFEGNFELESPFGWPQLIVQIYGYNFFGLSEIRGYGSTHIPSQSGTHERTIRIYKTLATNSISQFFSYFTTQEVKMNDVKKTIGDAQGRNSNFFSFIFLLIIFILKKYQKLNILEKLMLNLIQ